MSKNLPKNQHYVPQFLLRNFVFNEQDKIYAFDKKEERVFTVNIRNVASENKFYDIETEDYLVSLEPSLGAVENQAAEIIRKILFSEAINSITDEEKIALASFIAIQILRGKQIRQNYLGIDQSLQDLFEKRGIDPKDVANYEPIDKDYAKSLAISSIQNYQDLVPALLDKWWMLNQTPITRPFFISDNPVVMHNSVDHGFRGNLGLAIMGIEVYFPLSKTITLALLCPSHMDFVIDSYEKLHYRRRHENEFFEQASNRKKYKNIKALWSTLQTGKAFQTMEHNQIFMNSLQIAYAERFIFSYNNNFSLAFNILRDHPQMKKGMPRMTSNHSRPQEK